MIPTPIQTPESESESLFDSDSVVRIAPCLSHSEAVHYEANYILVFHIHGQPCNMKRCKMNRFFCGMGLPKIAIVVAAIVVGDNYIFHVRRN